MIVMSQVYVECFVVSLNVGIRSLKRMAFKLSTVFIFLFSLEYVDTRKKFSTPNANKVNNDYTNKKPKKPNPTQTLKQ